MKLQHPIVIVLTMAFCSANSMAATYKCTDTNGKTSYQSSPCIEANKASEMNMKTGGLTDLSVVEKKQALATKLQTQEQQEQHIRLEKMAQIKQQAIDQSELNQQLIRKNPQQFSAFAIPPYKPDNLPPFVKQFENRLPEIEYFRGVAAVKALETDECRRVEAVNLSVRSKAAQFVFSVDCSSAKTFFYTETELVKKHE